MRVLMFQDRFAGKVLDGSKPHTMRKTARCKPGDVLSLRRWTGKPYRSKQETLRTETCLSVDPVRIENVPGRGFSVWVDGRGLLLSQIEGLALADGFDGYQDMVDWFMNTHGLPWDGFLIRWANICADCGAAIGQPPGPPAGWKLEDGRIVCHECCVKDILKIVEEATNGR